MPRAVSEIPAELPERTTGRIIDLATCRTLREYSLCQGDMPFQCQCVICLFLFRTRSQRNCTCYVCRTIEILSAGITEIKAVRFQTTGALRWRNKVRQSGIRAIGRDGLETVSPVADDFGTQGIQFAGGIPFIDFLALGHAGLKPIKEFLHGETILKMGLLHALDFHIVFQCLAERYRRCSPYEGDMVGNRIQHLENMIVER